MKPHRFDPLSLVFGLVFAALGAMHLAGVLDPRLLSFRWVVAGALIALGIALMASGRPRSEPDPDAEPRSMEG